MPKPSIEKAVFQAAIQFPDTKQRSDYLEAACQGDCALRSRIEDLLAASEDDGFMQNRAVDSLAGTDSAHLRVEAIADEKTSQRIDKYKLLQKIGEGGFGVVYMAEQMQPVRRRVALKIIKLGMDTRQVIARFEAERQALAMMDHPNIAKVLDAGSTETGRPYFVMELVRGVPITQFCDENNLPTEERLAIFADVCSAIQHAHQKGIIHRDIKPTNVMITMHDDQPVVKVIDFGIAKATEHRLTEKTLFTDYAQMIGTPSYMSPEQAQMSGLDVDTRSDVYSLGVLLYELLVGQPPFDPTELRSCGYDEMCRRIREEEPLKPSTRLSTLTDAEMAALSRHHHSDPVRLNRIVRGELDWIVMKALEKDRRRRYETASSLAADIRHYLNEEPVSAVAPSAWYRMQKFWARNQVVVLTAGAFCLLLMLGTVLSTWQAVRATRATRVANAEKNRALTAEQRAELSERAARRNEYTAEMNLGQQAMRHGNVVRAREIVERHYPDPDEPDLRDFEWRWLWAGTHRERYVLQADDAPFDAAFSPDGRLLATAARWGGLRFWDFREQEEIGAYPLSDPGGHPMISFSPDGRLLAVKDAGAVVLWDVARKAELKPLRRETSSVSCFSFSLDGSIVAGYDDGMLLFWDTDSEEHTSISAYDSSTVEIAFSADGAFFSTADAQGHIQVWNYDTKHQIREISGHPGERCTVLSPDGKMVASSSTWGPTKVWDVESGEMIKKLPVDSSVWVNDLAFSPDGAILAVAMITGSIKMFDTQTWQEITSYEHLGHQLNTIAFSPTDDLLVSAGDAGLVMVWDAQPRPTPRLLASHPSFVGRAIFSPDNRVLGVACTDGSVTLWNVDTKSKLLAIDGLGSHGPPRSEHKHEFLAFSPGGQRLAVSALPKELHQVHLWDIQREERVDGDVLKHDSAVYSLAYSPDGRLLAVGCDGTVYLWELATMQIEKRLPIHRHALSLAFSPDSKVLASEDWGDVKIWDIATGERLETLPEFVTIMGGHESLVFSPAGDILAAGGYDGRVLLWDTKTWEPREPLLGHSAPLLDISFSPDGQRLASAGLDGEAKIWSIDDGREVATFLGMTVDFSQDGNVLAVGGLFELPFGTSELSSSVRLYCAPTFEQIEYASEKRQIGN